MFNLNGWWNPSTSNTSRPTYLCQPKGDAASTATLALTVLGKTE